MQQRTGEALEKFKNPDNDPRGVWTSGDLTSKTKAQGHSYAIISPSGKEFYPPEGRQWAPAYETYLRLKNENRLWFGEDGNNVPRQKQFLTEIQEGVVPTSILFHADSGHNQEAKKELISLLPGIGNSFETPKPVRLICRLLRLVNLEDDDIILDFFSGSATTAQAVMQNSINEKLNCHFIMIQIPELCESESEAYKAGYKNICEIGKERIRRVGKQILDADRGQTILNGDKPTVDVGFKVFKLDSSNLKVWDDSPIADDDVEELIDRLAGSIDGLKSSRAEIDMVYEIILKMGYPLTASVVSFTIGGITVYSVNDNDMLICLQSNVTVECIEAMETYNPQRIVLTERSFTDNSTLSNAHYLLENRGIKLEVI